MTADRVCSYVDHDPVAKNENLTHHSFRAFVDEINFH